VYVLLLVISVTTIIAIALISVRTQPSYHVKCTASQYTIQRIHFTTNDSTIDTTTRFAGVATYTTTTLASAPPGYVTIRITTQQSITGAVAAGGESICTYLPR
jgi:hypothetical protein